MLHEAIFLATCNATNVALKVARKNSGVTPRFETAIVALRVARKVERPSTFCNVARQVDCVQHPLCNLKGFLFVIIVLQVARKIASCNIETCWVTELVCHEHSLFSFKFQLLHRKLMSAQRCIFSQTTGTLFAAYVITMI